MTKYTILILVYLISVASFSMAHFIGIDVQNLYRVPFINIRWIDIAILIIPFSIIFKQASYRNIKNDSIVFLCVAYLVFELFQLIRSWGDTDVSWQISGFIATLCYLILIDLSLIKVSQQRFIIFIKYIIFGGTIALLLNNIYLIFSFYTGNVIFTDLDRTVGIDVMGSKETVATAVLTPLVYAYGLFFLKYEDVFWKKAIHSVAVISILIMLVLKFSRGDLFTVSLLTVIYLVSFSKNAIQLFRKIIGLSLLIILFLLMFKNSLTEKGYDPVERISQIAEFMVDTDNSSWEKGRSIPYEYALSAWEKNIFFGVGYNDLHQFGLPKGMGAAHNFVIASLFHRGVIGTAIYLLILSVLFWNAIKLWFLLGEEKSLQNDIFRILIVVSFFWLVPAITQDVIWEKYSLSVQFIYLAIIRNIYIQKRELIRNAEITYGIKDKIIFEYDYLQK